VTVESEIVEDVGLLGGEDTSKRMSRLMNSKSPQVRILAARTLFLKIYETIGPDRMALIKEMKKAAGSVDVEDPKIREEMTRIKSVLSKAKPCSRCKGTHYRKCNNGCNENGQFVKVCPKCRGTGRIRYRGRERRCGALPRGMKQHREVKSCPKCRGSKRMECSRCKAPWGPPPRDTMVKITGCPTCYHAGFLRGTLKMLCPDCFGLGQRFAPAE
jgi:hypothetical protein